MWGEERKDDVYYDFDGDGGDVKESMAVLLIFKLIIFYALSTLMFPEKEDKSVDVLSSFMLLYATLLLFIALLLLLFAMSLFAWTW